MDITEQILALSAYNTPMISDALDAIGVNGLLEGIHALQGHKVIGPAYTVEYQLKEEASGASQHAGDYFDHVPAGSVVVIDNRGNTSCSVWGGILSGLAMKKKLAGTVVHGLARDIEALQKIGYPVFAKGLTPRTGKHRVVLKAHHKPISMQGVEIYPNDIIFGDGNGVLVIPKDKLDMVLVWVQNIARNEAAIVKDLQAGETLKKAREKHHYHEPWKNSEKRK